MTARFDHLRALRAAVRPPLPPEVRFARGNAAGGSGYALQLDAIAASAPDSVAEPPDLPPSIARLVSIRRAWRAAESLPAGLRGPPPPLDPGADGIPLTPA